MSHSFHPVIGIDLGTTYSAVSAYNLYTEKAEVIRNSEESNDATTPSVIGFDRARARVIVGKTAKRNLAADPVNTIVEIKREMGELFRPETLERYDPQRLGGFRARAPGRSDGEAADPVRVRFCGEWYLPQEISAFTLMKMKHIAEVALGSPVIDAVITVPAYFTETQRKATKEAAKLAGLYPRQLVPEPTAAAICYGVDKFEDVRRTYLVYDLGGGTFDVSIISVEENKIEVIATAGDRRLGGGDFDDAIAEWAVQLLVAEHGLDIRNDRGSKAIVKFHAERLKIELSTFERAQMTLPEIRPTKPPTLELTRERFESLIAPLIQKSLSCVDDAINAAGKQRGVRREDIDAILLVGGSSKIPRVKSLLLDHFRRDETFVRADLDPDEVVARGAAVLARRFAPSEGPFDIERKFDEDGTSGGGEDLADVHLITEHSLGIGVNDGEVVHIVTQGTNIPVSVTRGGFTNGGPTQFIPVHVYQGEGHYIHENDLIGVVPLGPMEPKPEGYHKFEVTFSLDRSGLLSAVVNHLNEGQVYAARFDQKTSLGGDKALAKIREKLVSMYGPAKPTAPVPPPIPAIVPPAISPAIGPPVPTIIPSAIPPPIPLAIPPQVPAAILPAAPSPKIPEATREIPAEFAQLVRRVKKQLLAQWDTKLAEAYSSFINAVNLGSPLTDLGDTLADTFDVSRR